MGDDKPVEPVFDLGYSTGADDWGMEEKYTPDDAAAPMRGKARCRTTLGTSRVCTPPGLHRLGNDTRLREPGGKTVWRILSVRLKGRLVVVAWPLPTRLPVPWTEHDVPRFHGPSRRAEGAFSPGSPAGTMDKLDWLEANGLLSPNWEGTYVGSGGIGYTDELPQSDYSGSACGAADLWGFSGEPGDGEPFPRKYEEFIFPVKNPLWTGFGLTCYGLLASRCIPDGRCEAPPQPAPSLLLAVGRRGEDGRQPP